MLAFFGGVAQAGPNRAAFEAGASTGVLIPLGAGDAASDGTLYRVDAGVGFGAVHLGGLLSLSLHNAAHYDSLLDPTSPIAGDFQLSRLGASVRWAPTIGRFVPSVRAEAAVITFLSPFDSVSYQEDVLPQLANAGLGVTSTGLLVGGGADAAYAIVPDHAWASLSVDVGLDTLPGLGLEVGVRLGLSAAL